MQPQVRRRTEPRDAVAPGAPLCRRHSWVAADLILVMAGGEIVERGNHRELLALGGRYAELVAAQMEGDEVHRKG